MDFFRKYQMHIPIQSRSRIPSRGIWAVFKPDGQGVGPLLQIGRYVNMEGIVTVWPPAYFLSVQIDAGIAHGPVEKKGCMLPLRHGQFPAIPSAPHIGQAAGTASLDGRLFLIILCYNHFLKVVIPAERPVNGPVMGNPHRLPGR